MLKYSIIYNFLTLFFFISACAEISQNKNLKKIKSNPGPVSEEKTGDSKITSFNLTVFSSSVESYSQLLCFLTT